MLTKVAEKPGYSWRVGLHPPLDESASQNINSAVAMAVLSKNTKPALMQVRGGGGRGGYANTKARTHAGEGGGEYAKADDGASVTAARV